MNYSAENYNVRYPSDSIQNHITRVWMFETARDLATQLNSEAVLARKDNLSMIYKLYRHCDLFSSFIRSLYHTLSPCGSDNDVTKILCEILHNLNDDSEEDPNFISES